MSVSRRFFMVGAGGLITANFIKDARAAIRDTGQPLLIPPPEPQQELLLEWVGDEARLHLGDVSPFAPPPPLRIVHLRECGYELETPAQIAAYCDDSGEDEESLWRPVDAFGWEDWWEHFGSSEAKAYELLDSKDIFPSLRGFAREGRLVFEAFPNPMSSARWVEVRDRLSVSLLQARLNELDLNIAVRDARPEEMP